MIRTRPRVVPPAVHVQCTVQYKQKMLYTRDEVASLTLTTAGMGTIRCRVEYPSGEDSEVHV